MNRNSLATASLAMAAFGLFTMLFGGSFVFGGMAVILAILSRGVSKMDKKAKVAIAVGLGSILGTLVIFVSAIFTFVINRDYRAMVTDYIRYYGEMYEQQFGENADNPYKDLLKMIDEALPVIDAGESGQ